MNPSELDLLRDIDPDLPVIGTDQWRAAWDSLFRAAHEGLCWVARARQDERGGEGTWEVVGYIASHRCFFGRMFIEHVMVAEAMRRRGVATALIRHVESRCRGRDVFTSVRASRAGACTFLERLEYEPAGELHGLNEDDPQRFYLRRVPSRKQRRQDRQYEETDTPPVECREDVPDGDSPESGEAPSVPADEASSSIAAPAGEAADAPPEV